MRYTGWREKLTEIASAAAVTECIPFFGASIDANGYGRFGAEQVIAHRAVYELAHGPLPSGLQIHHRCGNKKCLNPSHLVALSPAQHMRHHRNWEKAAAAARAATHCPNGHEYNAQNTRFADGRRICRVCNREWMRRSRAAAKQKKGLVT